MTESQCGCAQACQRNNGSLIKFAVKIAPLQTAACEKSACRSDLLYYKKQDTDERREEEVKKNLLRRSPRWPAVMPILQI